MLFFVSLLIPPSPSVVLSIFLDYSTLVGVQRLYLSSVVLTRSLEYIGIGQVCYLLSKTVSTSRHPTGATGFAYRDKLRGWKGASILQLFVTRNPRVFVLGSADLLLFTNFQYNCFQYIPMWFGVTLPSLDFNLDHISELL